MGAAAMVMATLLVASASAAAPEFLFRAPAEGIPGSGAGLLDGPRGATTNPSTGHVYVSDGGNARISEFTAWGLFVKAWGWGVSNGAAELQTCGPTQPEVTPSASLCRQGQEGIGKGELERPNGIDLDSAGNVYVLDRASLRVQKFSPTGEFLLMFGGEVNETKVTEGAPAAEQDICPVAVTDVCKAGTPGSGPSHFAGTVGNYIAYSPTANAILVGDKDRIQVFNLNGSFREEIPFEGELAAFDEKSVSALEVDAEGNIYLVVGGLDDVYKLSPAGVPLEPGKPGSSKFKVKDPIGAVAVDSVGDVYAGDEATIAAQNGGRIVEYDAAGDKLLPSKEEEEREELFPFIPFHGPAINGLATNLCAGSDAPGNLYLTAFRTGEFAYLEGYGTPPIGCEPPPPAAPEITAQFATAVSSESATVKAQINPHFWNDTTYYVEYGTGKCSEGGCPSKEPLPPGSKLTSKVLNRPVTSGGLLLTGLSPGTTYHYRFVAQSGGGGPVFGIDPDGEGAEEASFEESLEGAFRAFKAPTNGPGCPNEEFRSGPGAQLPDCRAYELVSPLDKSNGDAALLPSTMVFFELNQSSTSGDRFTYASITPFAEPESTPFISQFLSSRDPEGGWSSESISPPRSARALEIPLSLNNEYKAFTPDLCMAWLRHNSDSTLAAGAIPGYANLYRRDNCSAPPSYEALSTAKPPSRPAETYKVTPVGFSEDGTKTIFLAADALTPDAPELPEVEAKEFQLYEHTASGLHFVCNLPNGSPYTHACAAGMAAGQPDGKASAVQNAISADGSRVFWTAYKGNLGVAPEGIPGQIYLRLNPDREESASPPVDGECGEPTRACTIAVSGAVTSEPAQYWGASHDGSKAIFKVVAGELKGNLYEFDVKSEEAQLIAKGVEGPMGLSEDASRIYLDSTKVLGEGASEGAKEGAHNLYLYEAPKAEGEGGSFSFVMALAGRDLQGTELQPGPISEVPTARSATVSADGLHAAFSSAASPTPRGYDNLDAVSGQADQEAYLYDAQTKRLRCVSCNPSGARPAGQNINTPAVPVWAAARLPNPRSPLNAPHPLTASGKRLFFESHEALVPRDTNGTWDVYQWEAPGTGSCDESDGSFDPASGGCIELISSGESPAASHLLDADADGSDVFIGTQSSLIASDFGSNDVYDARIGGGFALPSSKAPCEGEACQNPPGPPAEVTPASSAFEGNGNLRKRKACRRGTHRVHRHGKARCVKKKHKRRAHRAAHRGARGAAR